MGYLLPTEYVEYGLPAGTADEWVTMASALMESYCRRVSLLATQYVERMRLTAGSQAVRDRARLGSAALWCGGAGALGATALGCDGAPHWLCRHERGPPATRTSLPL